MRFWGHVTLSTTFSFDCTGQKVEQTLNASTNLTHSFVKVAFGTPLAHAYFLMQMEALQDRVRHEGRLAHLSSELKDRHCSQRSIFMWPLRPEIRSAWLP
jgi:hypothetical protein